MSQPEMQPEGAPRNEPGTPGSAVPPGSGPEAGSDPDPGPGSGSGSGSGARGGDLTGQPFPLGDWGEPAERLDELYRYVEADALRTAGWYLADRVWKRRGARALRIGTAAGVVAGAALPLLDLTGRWTARPAGAICRCCWAPLAWPAIGSSA